MCIRDRAYEAPVAGEIAVVHIAEGEVVEEDQLAVEITN